MKLRFLFLAFVASYGIHGNYCCAQDSDYAGDVKLAVARGVRLGMTLDECDKAAIVDDIVKQTDLQRVSDLKDATGSQIKYVQQRTYGNGKPSGETATITVKLTPPVPASQDSKVYSIEYVTQFSKDVDVQKLAADLKAKYNIKDVNATRTEIRMHRGRASDSESLGVSFSVFIRLPESLNGLFGIAEIELQDSTLEVQATEAVQAYIQKLESERPKNTTQPKF